MIFSHPITNFAIPNSFNANQMLDIHGEQVVSNMK